MCHWLQLDMPADVKTWKDGTHMDTKFMFDTPLNFDSDKVFDTKDTWLKI